MRSLGIGVAVAVGVTLGVIDAMAVAVSSTLGSSVEVGDTIASELLLMMTGVAMGGGMVMFFRQATTNHRMAKMPTEYSTFM